MNTTTNKAPETMKIDGREYVVISAKPYTYKGDARTEYALRLPRGQKVFHAYKYGNSTMSGVV